MQVPPIITTTNYQGYFVNEQGVCNFFNFDYKVRRGILTRYEGGVVSCYNVFRGVPDGFQLSTREQLWLRACWNTVQVKINQIKMDRRTTLLPAPQIAMRPLAPRTNSHLQNPFRGRMSARRKARQRAKND